MLSNIFSRKKIRRIEELASRSDINVIITDMEGIITEKEREKITEIVQKAIFYDEDETQIVSEIKHRVKSVRWRKISYALVCNNVEIII